MWLNTASSASATARTAEAGTIAVLEILVLQRLSPKLLILLLLLIDAEGLGFRLLLANRSNSLESKLVLGVWNFFYQSFI